MERNSNYNQPQRVSGSGFLLGVIVGVILTLLLITKRGRAILKDILEKGAEKFANLEQLMRETEKNDEEELFSEDDDFIHSEPIDIQEPLQKSPEKKPEATKPEPQEIKPAHPASRSNAPDETAIVKPIKVVESEKAIKEKVKTGGKRWFRGLSKKG